MREHGATALQYGAGQGQLALRERLTMLMATEGLEADPDDVVVTTGAQQALDLLGKIFIDPGDTIAVEAPTYVGALGAFGAYQPRYLHVEVDQDGMLVEHLEEALFRGERPKFVYTVPNFGNPSGVTMTLERRQHLVALCREIGIPIVEDNPYGLLRFDGDPLPCLKTLDPDNVIYLGTVSKTFSPGRPRRLGARRAIGRTAPRAGEGSGRSVRVEPHDAHDGAVVRGRRRWRGVLAGLVDTYRARRIAMAEAIAEHFPDDAACTDPHGGFYLWVTLPSWFDTRAMLAAAVERRVAYVPGTAFYADGRGANQMRLAFCLPTEDRIREGIARLGALLADEEHLYRSIHR